MKIFEDKDSSFIVLHTYFYYWSEIYDSSIEIKNPSFTLASYLLNIDSNKKYAHQYVHAMELMTSSNYKDIEKGEKILFRLAKSDETLIAEAANYQLLLFNSINCVDAYYVPSMKSGLRYNFPSKIILELNSDNINWEYKGKQLSRDLPNTVAQVVGLIYHRIDLGEITNSEFSKVIGYEYYLQCCNKGLSKANAPDIRAFIVDRFLKKTGKFHDYAVWTLPTAVSRLSILYPYIYEMNTDNQFRDIGLTAEELLEEGKKWEEKWRNLNSRRFFINAVFYYTRAALYGSLRGLESMLNVYITFYDAYPLPGYEDDGELSQAVGFRRLFEQIKRTKLLSEFSEFLEPIIEYNEETYNICWEKRRDKIEKENERKNREFGAKAFQAIMYGVNSALNAAYNPNIQNSYNNASSYTNLQSTNMDYLVDPRFTIAQINAQEQVEYQAVRENYQRMGKDLSIFEWRVIKGEALQNLKNEGYDVIAENKKIIDDNKAFEEELRQKERRQRLERNRSMLDGIGNAYSVTTTSSNSYVTQAANQSAKTQYGYMVDNQKAFSTVKNKDEQGLDSRQQFKTEKVSSDDYRFIKHVTIYIRADNKNNVMFRNKDLCEKSGQYYVKIDGKYYVVRNVNHWGFNSSISYGHGPLYFNK